VQPRKQFDSKFIKSVEAQKENELKLELALEAKLERKKIEVEIFFHHAISNNLFWCKNKNIGGREVTRR